jgi:aminodeoxyfutalosine deaminase
MGFLKYKGDFLFTGHELLAGDKVLIMNENGRVEAITDRLEAGEDVQYQPGILCPGFVNAHCHLELSHLKGQIGEQTGMVDFLLSVVGQRSAGPDAVLQAMKNAEEEMLRNGIVAVGDICNTAHSFELKRHQRLHYYNFLEATGFIPEVAGTRYEAMQQLQAVAPGPASIVPHAPYSVSPELFGLIFSQPQQVVSMHNQECEAENEFLQQGAGDFTRLYKELEIDISFFKPTGNSSLQSVLHYFKNAASFLLVHNCVTCNEDIAAVIKLLNYYRLTFCLCPNANLYINGMLPNIELLHQSSVPICLGTDSLASNHQLSIAAEINTIRKHFPAIPIASILQWATLNGAKALCMDDELGSFAKGKRPGMVWI